MNSINDLAVELDRRLRRESFTAESLCFGPQRAAALSTAKRKLLRCSRRAGKTYLDVIVMLERAVKRASRGGAILYLTLTRVNAKEIAWADLLHLNEQFSLGGVPNLTDLSLVFAKTGGVIQLRGANNEREIAKIRGKKFELVIIDEAQSVPDRILRPLIREVIGPALVDYGGELWLVGTPPPVKAGYFWECYAGKHRARWEQHHWTMRENERLPAVLAGRSIDDILSEVREENGWDETDPTYRREYLGEDVEDLESLLFHFGAPRNEYLTAPTGAWTYVMGVDIGHDDSDAIAVLGWCHYDRRIYLLEEHVADQQDVTDLADRLRPLIDKYRPITVACDQGGLGKKIVVELQRRQGLALTAAEKAHKSAYIKLLNTDLRKGLLLAKPGSRFAQDCRLVQKDPQAWMRGELNEKPVAHGGFHSDICDAVLYDWQAALAFLEKDAPKPVTLEARTEQEEEEFLERQRGQQGAEWWEQA